MHAEHLDLATLATHPWKNGLGSTQQLAIYPCDASLEDFGWRISCAQVTHPGPFSAFPGVDRSLAVLSGDGMELYDAQKKITLRPCSSPASFPGEVPIRASLVGSKITDFNLMTRRGLFSHTLQHRHLAGQEQIAPLADNLLIWCNTGTLDYNTKDGSLSGSLRTDQGLLVTNLATPLKLRATHACLYIAEIHAS